MLLAMTNRQPDRVPVAPDMSNMIPCRLTGRPFYSIYWHQDPPLWQAYLDALDYFGFDGWFIYGHLDLRCEWRCAATTTLVQQMEQALIARTTWNTPAGELRGETIYAADTPPAPRIRPMRQLPEDFVRWRYTYPRITGYDDTPFRTMQRALGERGAISLTLPLPGFQAWCDTVEGTIETLTYAFYDHPDMFEEWRQLEHAQCMQLLEFCLEVRPDFILVGASGLLTLQSPELFRRLSLPTLIEITRRCREAGMPTMLHACGKERYLVEVFANETCLDCVNPLEPPPMGDCDLREIKAAFGDRIALMGNLHTTEVMLRGSPDDVEQACLDALAAAKGTGGFILSTGDQCPRDTPDANIRRMIAVARDAGRY
jgi:uroporphyrinogen decarboxylase